jgi:8-oxo-dGTP diphosphatase
VTISDPIKASRQPTAPQVVGHSGFSPLRLVRAAQLVRRIEAVLAEDSHCSAKAVILNQLGEVLILTPSDGDWADLPGGRIHDGEDAVTGLAREVREETGLSIGDIKLAETVAFKDFKKVPRTTLLYRAVALTTDVRLSAEHADYRWVKPQELAGLKLGFLAEPVRRTLDPATISATESVLITNTVEHPSHHETARRAAEKIYQAAADSWLSELSANLIAAIFGRKGMDYDGVWLDVYGAAAGGWVAVMSQAAQQAYSITAQTLGHDAGVSLQPSEEALKAFANARGSALERFPGAVRDKVAASLKRGLAGNEDARALARRLAEDFDQIQTGAARRVAATEAQVTYGVSQSEVLAAAGYSRKKWVTVGDDRVRDSHYLCESQGAIPASESFHNGLKYPGDPNGDISELANCRCNLEGAA